jgi:two-component system cell cycle sensor histidine kinase/response regulator CckA
MIVSIAETARDDWSRVIVSFFDVTDRKRLEEEVLQSQKMESLGRLAGGIAHDFNNLLTVINVYTDWVLRDLPPDDRFRTPLGEVRKAGERCAELTRQLLAFGRKQIARPAPLDLNDLIRESQRVLDRMLGDDVQLRIDLAPDLGIVEADRGQMHQVLMNLAVNAREAMPGGGALTLRTGNVEGSEQILLEVRDTGQGMDASVRSRLFEPFYTTKKRSSNSGLGLAIVFGIVSSARGRIEVQSEPGAGAAFRIYLPRGAGAAVADPVETRPAQALRRGRVLVVDDREDVRMLTCRMVEHLGLEALAAAGGREALDLLSGYEGPPPLLLTDVVMPGMSGRELASDLRRRFPEITVVFMSGYTHSILNDAGAPPGSTLYIQKPFTTEELGAVLRRAQDQAAQK